VCYLDSAILPKFTQTGLTIQPGHAYACSNFILSTQLNNEEVSQLEYFDNSAMGHESAVSISTFETIARIDDLNQLDKNAAACRRPLIYQHSFHIHKPNIQKK